MSDRTNASCRTPAQPSRTMPDRRRKSQQMDLFAGGKSGGVGAPTWAELPPETQRTLTLLMTRLFLEHADKSQAAPMRGAGHDL